MLLTCTGSFYPTFYENYWLLWINPVKKTTETCQPCPTGCLTCAFCSGCYRSVNCLSCVAGMSLKLVNLGTPQYVCRCPDGLWANAVDNLCYACNVLHPGCGDNTCTGVYTSHYTSLCTTCNPGYYGPTKISIPGWSGYTSCGTCPLGCSSCSSATSCSNCFGTTLVSIGGVCYCKTASTYYSSSSKSCVICDTLFSNCASCVNITTSTNCTSCKIGFYLASPTSCSLCQPNCNVCTSTLCTSCKPSYISSGALCICDSNSSMVYQTSANTCVLCSSIVNNCADCNSGIVTCLTCKAGFYFVN